MPLKTIVVDYEPRAKKMAQQIESVANEMERQGYTFVTFSITESANAILVFRGAEQDAQVSADGKD